MFGEKLDPSCWKTLGPNDTSRSFTHHHPWTIRIICSRYSTSCDECIQVIAHLDDVLVTVGSIFTLKCSWPNMTLISAPTHLLDPTTSTTRFDRIHTFTERIDQPSKWWSSDIFDDTSSSWISYGRSPNKIGQPTLLTHLVPISVPTFASWITQLWDECIQFIAQLTQVLVTIGSTSTILYRILRCANPD